MNKCCAEKNLIFIDTEGVFQEIYKCSKCNNKYYVDVELVRDFNNLKTNKFD